ncbi:zona occludens toxin [Variovorax sp. TBS-050B]|uniref:zonular occludens toxin domain-containing protein n=1 Tax=Variovorax sp. TBS-050B TaxID=2940551 RepID=UPI00247521F8|nr:zonular occludens toxin domain-containing protein [Variovorax sp. TBS-050B]MDH6594340.1 zona occludens toxin [Variovorax sp. TBS-050B]
MITVITGTPGAGKTLYTVSKLLLSLVGTTIKQEVDGEVVEYPRTIYTNIRGLMIDHELIDGSASGGLRNWHEWAKPGSVIVFDEIQKVWEPRANGSKVPDDIKALETHRHMGVDFILITQGLMLTERNLAMLCNRHLHVRRVGNMPFAIVYEWDHASRTLMYSKAITKAPWRYDKKVFKLYKSADLHTKQKRSIPTLLYFVLAGVAAFAILAPTLKARMSERFGDPKAVQSSAAKPGAPATMAHPAAAQADAGKADATKAGPPIDDTKDWVPRDPLRPESAPVYDSLRRVAVMPVLVGCMSMGKRAQCYTQQGTVVEVHPDMARSLMDRPRFDPYEPQKRPEATTPLPSPQNAPDGLAAPRLVVIDGPGWRDPQGMQSAQGGRR